MFVASLLADIPPDPESSGFSWLIVIAVVVAVALALIAVGLIRRQRSGRSSSTDSAD